MTTTKAPRADGRGPVYHPVLDFWQKYLERSMELTQALLTGKGSALDPAALRRQWLGTFGDYLDSHLEGLALLESGLRNFEGFPPFGLRAPAEAARPRPGVLRPGGVDARLEGKVAVVTGAASGIGEATAHALARRGVRAVALVDRSPNAELVARAINEAAGRRVAEHLVGDTTDPDFRSRVFDEVAGRHGVVNLCVPAAGITRDALAVRVDKDTGKAVVYPLATFRQVTEVNLIAPLYWALEMVARIAEERRRRGLGRWEPAEGPLWGAVVFIGSVSAQGNKGQLAYAATKAGLEGAAATLTKEAIYHGVRCCVVHPGFTDTPMVRALGEDYIAKNVLPFTQLHRLIRPDEIADAVCFLIANAAVSGELFADAGWHPSA
jgi:NAD(P)-dependent dehydrogenase (short-subunit alcohol dehydrogenase family)